MKNGKRKTGRVEKDKPQESEKGKKSKTPRRKRRQRGSREGSGESVLALECQAAKDAATACSGS